MTPLPSGGGWQDQYGGVLQGVKLLQTESSPVQIPSVNWLPESIFTSAEYAPCHILYYTGITRTAKAILAEIVRNMFLNHGETLALLGDMKEHAAEMANAIQRCDFRNTATASANQGPRTAVLTVARVPTRSRP